MNMKHGLTIAALLFVVFAMAVADRARAVPMGEAHNLCYGYADLTIEVAKARDRGVTHEEALEVVAGEASIYTEIVNFVFDNPQAGAASLAAEVYHVCMTQTVTEE